MTSAISKMKECKLMHCRLRAPLARALLAGSNSPDTTNPFVACANSIYVTDHVILRFDELPCMLVAVRYRPRYITSDVINDKY